MSLSHPAEPHRHRLRDTYRRSLGVKAHQRLVVITSAKTGHGLFAHHATLPERLFAALPIDEYAVVFLPHPNLVPQPVSLFRTQVENGLLMLEPGQDWPGAAYAVAAAADGLIGDHGTVTYHAAALGIPTATASFDLAKAPLGSPLRGFGEQATPFDPSGDLLAQTDRLCATGILPAPGTDTTGPKSPQTPTPANLYRPTSAWRCKVTFNRDGVVTWRRVPATGPHLDGPGHLVTEVRCLDPDARNTADIIVRSHEPLPEPEAHFEAQCLLREQPLATIVSVRCGDDTMIWYSPTGDAVRAQCQPEHLDVAASIWFETGRPHEGRWDLSGPTGKGLLRVTQAKAH